VDALPPPPPAAYAYAPGDVAPRGAREEELCNTASRPDWLYLGALVAIDVGAFWGGTQDVFKYGDIGVRMMGPAIVGLAWGATIGGGYLALPKCDKRWVSSPPREGNVRASWPLALSLALFAGATAPIINTIGIGYPCGDTSAFQGHPRCQGGLPAIWSDEERAMHLVTAGLAGFGGALLPYVVPPRTWSAAREIERLRFGADARGNVTIGYVVAF
jgi:hypothetical protein